MNIFRKTVISLSILAVLNSVSAETVSESKEGDAIQLLNMPKNLARAHMGASVLAESSKGKFSRVQSKAEEIALIGDDEALSFELEQGSRSLVIDLGARYPVHTFAFKSYSAEGDVQVMTANRLRDRSSGQWRKIARPVAFSENDLVRVSFPSVEARYVRIDFDNRKTGEISNVNVSGDITIADVLKYGRIRLGELREFHAADESVELEVDFASLYAGSNINLVGVTSGSSDLQNMFDENLHSFAGIVGAERGKRTLTVDLKEASSLDKLSLNIDGFVGEILVDSIFGNESAIVAKTMVSAGKQLLQIEFDEASVAEKVKITFSGQRSVAAGLTLGEIDPLASARIYEMSLIGRRNFNEKDLEEPLLFFPRETIVEFSPPEASTPVTSSVIFGGDDSN